MDIVEVRHRLGHIRASLMQNKLFRFCIKVFGIETFARQFSALVVLIILRRIVHGCRKRIRVLFRPLVCLLSENKRKVNELRKERALCRTYNVFHSLCEKMDALDGMDKWKATDQSPVYDKEILKRRIAKYTSLKKKNDVEGCMYGLRGELLRKHFGTCNPRLFAMTRTGTKHIIEQYVSTVCDTMSWVAFSHRPGGSPIGQASLGLGGAVSSGAGGSTVASNRQGQPGPTVVEKLAFFNEVKHSFGRSALLLSGGASLGMYHFGVIKALHLNGLLPRIICGASAGSIICACVATRSDDHLEEMWDNSFSWANKFNLNFFSPPNITNFVRNGGEGLYSIDYLAQTLKENIGDFTFLEAFELTGRISNIVVSGLKGSTNYPMLLNYLTSPHVLIWSASAVSCSIPGVFAAGELLQRGSDGRIEPYVAAGLKWQDGSMQADLPMARLAELFNVNYFIVSQVNPQGRIFSGGGFGKAEDQDGHIQRCSQFVMRQAKQYLLSTLDLFNGAFGRVHPSISPASHLTPISLFVQEYVGDVTIFNGPGMFGMTELLENGTDAKLKRFTRESEAQTWWYIPQIRNACAIEFVMDEIIQELRRELVPGEQSVSKSGTGLSLLGRMPSYVSMSQEQELRSTERMRAQSIFAQRTTLRDRGDSTLGPLPAQQVVQTPVNPLGRRLSCANRSAGLLASSHSIVDLLTHGG